MLSTACCGAELIRQPPDLTPDDQYRLIFITSEQRDATSADIGDYNTFVQSVADASPVLGAWELEWKAFASTPSVDAIENLDIDPTIEGFPIYSLDAELIMPRYDTIFASSGRHDGPYFGALELSETGEPLDRSGRFDDFLGAIEVWTGTNALGRGGAGGLGHDFVNEQGQTLAAVGFPNFGADIAFSSGRGIPIGEIAYFYAVSGLLTAARPGDVNGDGNVMFDGFLILSENFGKRGPLSIGEINGNGIVDFDDFLILANNFDAAAEVESVPEPSGLLLLLFSGLIVYLSRSRSTRR